MRKTLIVFALLLPVLNCSAQTETTTNSRFQFGLSGSIDYSCFIVDYGNGQQDVNTSIFGERPGTGWSTGISCAYNLNQNWSLAGGLRFTEHIVKHGPVTFFTNDQQNPQPIGQFTLLYRNRFIDMPIGIQYNTSREKNIFFIGNVSLSPGYVPGTWHEAQFDQDAETAGFKNSIVKYEDAYLNRFSLKAEAYVGIGVNFGPVEVQVLAQGRYNLLQSHHETPFNRRYFSSGLEIRLFYRI